MNPKRPCIKNFGEKRFHTFQLFKFRETHVCRDKYLNEYRLQIYLIPKKLVLSDSVSYSYIDTSF